MNGLRRASRGSVWQLVRLLQAEHRNAIKGIWHTQDVIGTSEYLRGYRQALHDAVKLAVSYWKQTKPGGV